MSSGSELPWLVSELGGGGSVLRESVAPEVEGVGVGDSGRGDARGSFSSDSRLILRFFSTAFTHLYIAKPK